MIPFRWTYYAWLSVFWLALEGSGEIRADEPIPWIEPEFLAEGQDSWIQQVQQESPLEPTPTTPPAPTTAPSPIQQDPVGPSISPPGSSLLPSLFGDTPTDQAGSPRIGINVIPRSESLFRQTTDAGDPIGKSPLSIGSTTQKRTPIINAPIVRGRTTGDLLASGSFWFPARQDLDTMLNKIDSRLLSDIILIKGPYSSRFGPGFSFIDAELLPVARFPGGYESHGMTSGDYKTNGEQFYGRQMLWGGAENWGYRVSYGHRGGSDYESGNGTDIPASYKWRDVEASFGFDPTPTQHLDVHYLRLDQTDVELPGQFFDFDFLVTDAVEAHWNDEDPAFSDHFAFEIWYNRTRFEGNSQRPSKRRQIPVLDRLDFINTTAVDAMSTGYTMSSTWGEVGEPQLTLGADLRYIKQEIEEVNNFRVRGFNPDAAAADPTFEFRGLPAVGALIPTGRTIPAGFITDVPRPEFNTDLIFPSYQVNATKLVPRSHSSNPGLFVERLGAVGERLRLRAGARADWVSVSVEEERRFQEFDFNGIFVSLDEEFFPDLVPLPIIPIIPGEQRDLRETLGEKHYGLGSFYLTGEYDLNDNWAATFGGGYAMRPPTLTELYSFNGPFLAILQRGGNFVFGNTRLQVPRNWQIDLGLVSRYDRFRGGVNGYYSWVQDYITLRPLLPLEVLSIDPKAFAIQPVQFYNTPLATIFGGELFAEYDLNNYLTAFAVSSYIEGTDQERDQSAPVPDKFFPTFSRVPGVTVPPATPPETEPLPGIPPWDSRLGLRLHEPALLPGWGVEVSARVVDNQSRVARTLRELPTPGFTTYDLRSFWQVNENMLLLAGIENFTNKQYREHLDLRTGVFQPGINYYIGTQIVY